ncbi:metallophosphoesterase [Nocardia arthritidis]|uniref:metallophosphoesterase n=1 Tax=Nocardia arthritidis TaxID=228602 RepID=UPI00142E24AB|nr:metallophosphoesterase [Nocardia arthritidis]
MTKRIVVVPDLQIPFHDRRALKSVIQFIGDTQPDEVVLIGDVLDFPQPSRWNKDTRGEFEGSIYADVELAKRELFEPLRTVYDGRVMAHEGNHDERPRIYLDKYSPALSGTDVFDIDKLCDFDGFGISLAPGFYPIAPGWISTHGHLGGIRISQEAGKTALNAAKRFHKSVVMGHTHRLGLQPHSYGYDGRVSKVLWGFEVGNLMNMQLAGYLNGAAANWQQGFGLLELDGQHTNAVPVKIEHKKFIVDGSVWSIS